MAAPEREWVSGRDAFTAYFILARDSARGREVIEAVLGERTAELHRQTCDPSVYDELEQEYMQALGVETEEGLAAHAKEADSMARRLAAEAHVTASNRGRFIKKLGVDSGALMGGTHDATVSSAHVGAPITEHETLPMIGGTAFQIEPELRIAVGTSGMSSRTAAWGEAATRAFIKTVNANGGIDGEKVNFGASQGTSPARLRAHHTCSPVSCRVWSVRAQLCVGADGGSAHFHFLFAELQKIEGSWGWARPEDVQVHGPERVLIECGCPLNCTPQQPCRVIAINRAPYSVCVSDGIASYHICSDAMCTLKPCTFEWKTGVPRCPLSGTARSSRGIAVRMTVRQTRGHIDQDAAYSRFWRGNHGQRPRAAAYNDILAAISLGAEGACPMDVDDDLGAAADGFDAVPEMETGTPTGVGDSWLAPLEPPSPPRAQERGSRQNAKKRAATGWAAKFLKRTGKKAAMAATAPVASFLAAIGTNSKSPPEAFEMILVATGLPPKSVYVSTLAHIPFEERGIALMDDEIRHPDLKFSDVFARVLFDQVWDPTSLAAVEKKVRKLIPPSVSEDAGVSTFVALVTYPVYYAWLLVNLVQHIITTIRSTLHPGGSQRVPSAPEFAHIYISWAAGKGVGGKRELIPESLPRVPCAELFTRVKGVKWEVIRQFKDNMAELGLMEFPPGIKYEALDPTVFPVALKGRDAGCLYPHYTEAHRESMARAGMYTYHNSPHVR